MSTEPKNGNISELMKNLAGLGEVFDLNTGNIAAIAILFNDSLLKSFSKTPADMIDWLDHNSQTLVAKYISILPKQMRKEIAGIIASSDNTDAKIALAENLHLFETQECLSISAVLVESGNYDVQAALLRPLNITHKRTSMFTVIWEMLADTDNPKLKVLLAETFDGLPEDSQLQHGEIFFKKGNVKEQKVLALTISGAIRYAREPVQLKLGKLIIDSSIENGDVKTQVFLAEDLLQRMSVRTQIEVGTILAASGHPDAKIKMAEQLYYYSGEAQSVLGQILIEGNNEEAKQRVARSVNIYREPAKSRLPEILARVAQRRQSAPSADHLQPA